MSAFGTKKPGADLGVQLTFPGEFSRAYKQMKLGERYAPTGLPEPAKQEYVGSDFQAMEHMRRRDEAHAMVRAAVHATAEAKRRAFSSHAGYYGMPAPVLTQRVRGSNFGVGVGGSMGYPSPFGAMDGAGLEGGVIASREGRVYVKDLMAKRKAQLDAIDANQLEMPIVRAEEQFKENLDFSELSKIELLSFLDQLEAQVVARQFSFAPDTFRKFLTLLVRFAVVADDRELEQITTKVYSVIDTLITVDDQMDEGGQNPAGGESETFVVGFLDTLRKSMQAAYEYLRGMFKGLSMNPKDRMTLSKSLLRQLKFGEVSKTMIAAAQKAGQIPSFKGAQYRPHGGDDDLPGDDDEGGDEGVMEGAFWGDASTLGSAGVSRMSGSRGASDAFSRRPMSSELSSGPRFQLSRDVLRQPDVRDRFGAQGQAGEARAARRYAGEEEGPGAQLEQDFEADSLEAASAAGAPGLGSQTDSEVVRGAMDLLDRTNARRAGQDFPERAFQRLAQETGAPAAAAAEPESDIAEFYGLWDTPDTLPAVAEAIYNDMGRPAPGSLTSADLQVYVGRYEGARSVEQLRRIVNDFRGAMGLRPTTASTPKYLRQQFYSILTNAIPVQE